MKTEFVELSDTRKNLRVEISPDVVTAEIERVARDYSRAARIPGFRPGKVPPRVIKQRFRDQILHEVAHELIPRAVDEALRERDLEPVDAPDIRDVTLVEGQPLKFTAEFETVPPIAVGEYRGQQWRRPPATVADEDVERAIERLREASATYVPVEGRGVEAGDTVTLDLTRSEGPAGTPTRHEDVNVEIGAAANPPGFDQEVIGLTAGAEKAFDLQYPADYAIRDLAGRTVRYEARVKAIRRKVTPALDDEFAKDVGEFADLASLRARVRADLEADARRAAERELRATVVKRLAAGAKFEVPKALVERELDRQLEEFARRLAEQGIDPQKATVDWRALREGQREAAAEAVRGALVLDEIARREHLEVSEADLDAEVARYAEGTGRSVTAVRAQLLKDGALARLRAGLRREKAVDFLLANGTILDE